MRCRLWRLRPGHHVPVHTPALCPKCWAACRSDAEPGQEWCQECEQAALGSGDPRVVAWMSDLMEPREPRAQVLGEGRSVLGLLEA